MNLVPTEHNQQRILTTQQLAEAYGTDSKIISNNYNRNEKRYCEGKHFYCLEGAAKREFLNHHQIDDGSKNAQQLYLWTEKGAWLHAKSLNTDEAWNAYEMLVDEYFEMKSHLSLVPPLSPAQLLVAMAQQLADQEQILLQQQNQLATVQESTKELTGQVEAIKDTFTPDESRAWREQINQNIRKVGDKTGDFRGAWATAYEELDKRGFSMKRRMDNRKNRMAEQGRSKTEIERLSRLDVIEEDSKAREIFMGITREMVLRYAV